MSRTLRCAALALLFGWVLSLPSSAADLDPALFAGMKARSIGPAAVGGRITAIAASAADSNRLWIGTAAGGVWASEDGGASFEPRFDDQPVASIGAIAVDPSNPDVIWVGTGEGNPRNSVTPGGGVYKSTNGGQTWKRLGLEKTEQIHRVLLDPKNPNVAYVAALGKVWSDNPERGVYKTSDGGSTWKRILYIDEKTGCGDLEIDPSNPLRLYAAMWDFRREPWGFRSGGPGSGLYVTTDGGENWRRSSEADGLPAGDLGRIGLAVAASNPRVVYALIEAKKPGLARSEDGGRTWKVVNSEADVNPRPFYFADLEVDPQNENRVYRLQVSLDVSTDGGKSFDTLASTRAVHADHHALWIDPTNPRYLVNGNDGGIYVSRDGGDNWLFTTGLPLSQFYHVRHDNDVPYNVFGGLQDNGSWRGPSSVWEGGGIRNQHWSEVNFGDGFDTAPHPRSSRRGYAMSQGGYLVRWNLDTGERKSIRPAAESKEETLRFNWSAALATDPYDPDTVYFGSQFVHRSTDSGDTWTKISPDLSTNEPSKQKQEESGGITLDVTAAENHTTLTTIAPSAIERGLIWAGTDDGRLHVTRDGGKKWTSVEKNVWTLAGVPTGTWIPHVVPSPHEAGTAFVVFDDHRRGNDKTYVAKTVDYGKTWKSLASSDLEGAAFAIVQDPVDPALLFLGTERGLWWTDDGGRKWHPWRHGVPAVPVYDLAIHPREHDLLIATHGRGILVLDDIRPLRSLTTEALTAPVHLFAGGAAVQARQGQGAGSRTPGVSDFRGDNRPYGAVITYSLTGAGLPHPDEEIERARREERRKSGKVESTGGAAELGRDGRPKKPQAEIQIWDAAGKKNRTFEQDATLGVNRAIWDLRRDSFKKASRKRSDDFFPRRGPDVLPGTYKVKVTYGGKSAEGSVLVSPDPRVTYADGEREANAAAIDELGALIEDTAKAIERVTRTKADLKLVLDRAKKREDDRKRLAGTSETSAEAKALEQEGKALREKIEKVERALWIPDDFVGRPARTDLENRLDETVRFLQSSWEAPNATQRQAMDRVKEIAADVLAAAEKLFREDVPAFRAKAAAEDLELLGE